MLVDELTRLHNDMLLTMFSHNDEEEPDATHYLCLFESCFDVADVIVTMQSSGDLHINNYAVRVIGNLFTLRQLHAMCKQYDKDDVVRWVRRSSYSGRLHSALEDIDDYWESPEGLEDILIDPTFQSNLREMKF
jgi:hypothetical protein